MGLVFMFDLNFNILIIDDEETFLEEYKEALESYMSDNGFVLNVSSAESNYDYNRKNFDLTKFSLFMVDLKLGTSESGLTLINEIRKKCSTVDILFYSSDGDEIEQQKRNNDFEGMFFAKRDDSLDEITSKAKQLLDKQIRGANELVNMRGIVLQSMAEFDIVVKQLIARYYVVCENKYCANKRIATIINDSKKRSYKSFLKSINYNFNDLKFAKIDDEFVKNNSFNATVLCSDYKISDSSKNFEYLCYLFKKSNKELKGLNELYSFLRDIRNELAHQPIESLSNNDKYSPEGCVVIRKKLIEINKLLLTF